MSNVKALVTFVLVLLTVGSARAQNDLGCDGSQSGDGRPAIGCVVDGCCEFSFQVGSLCSGNYVCCYSRDVCSGGGNCNNADVVSRSGWGARPPTSISYMSLPVGYLFIHHTYTRECNSRSACVSEMQYIQSLHMDGNQWSDIGYSYLIGGDGGVYEGRGWNRVGAHTYGYNSVAVAISFIGDFTSKLPTAAALQAAKDIIACAENQGVLTSSYRMFGHRDGVCTECPGNTLYKEIQSWPHFSFDDIPTYC